MSDILDYLRWRGDISLSALPCCPVDDLILSRVAYMPFEGMISESATEPLLGELCDRILKSGKKLSMKQDRQFLTLLMESPRFSEMKVCLFRSICDIHTQEQFSAVTFSYERGSSVIFRGTDATIVGWKEDFNMSFSDVVPSQKSAVRFLEFSAARTTGFIRIAGHSKGGNLAVYSAAFSSDEIRSRVISISNFDGPGFKESVTASPGYISVIPVTVTYLPQSSVVGMLLEHAEDITIVRSQKHGMVFQHNIYSWEIERGGFVTLNDRTNSSYFVDDACRRWIASMEPQMREKIINSIYGVLSETNATHLSDLISGRSAAALMRGMNRMDSETRTVISSGLSLFFRSAKEALSSMRAGIIVPPDNERLPRHKK